MKKPIEKTMFLAVSALAVAGCVAISGGSDSTEAAIAIMKKDFKSRGQANVERLDQDEMQRVCSQYVGDRKLPASIAADLEKAQQALIKYPADGKLLGDWKAGEKVAQTGVGMQWSDDPTKPGGGNCYACHQLSKAELSFGTIGPSLYQFAKLRGYGVDIQKYAYAKIYNSQAFSACSSMPRFGHKGILNEQQMKDLTALLMDPGSPVNN